MKMRVADYIAQYVEGLGVDRIFLLSGGGMMHLLDAVGRRPGLKYVCQHHEQACAMAAEAYARRSGRLGVVYATSGPGGTNTVTGLVGAWLDSAPVLCVTGQSKRSQTIRGSGIEGLRQFGMFEVDIVPIVRSITKYAAFVDDPRSIRRHLEQACAIALSGRPGPVLLDVPLDVQGATIDPDELEPWRPTPAPPREPDDAAVDALLERLRVAKRPVLLAGHGVRVSGAVERLRALLPRLNVPTLTTQLGLDVLPFDHPLFVGRPGGKGDRAGNLAVQSADVILVVGASLHVATTGFELDRFAPRAYKVLVDPDPAVHAREQVGVREKHLWDVRLFIEALARRTDRLLAAGAPLVPAGAWHERCALWKRELAVMREPHKRPDGAISYYDLIEALSVETAGDETVVADAGSAFYIVGQAFRPKAAQRVILSGALGTMGYALPASTGAALAAPGRTTICVTGDGSLQTNLHELATLARYQPNVKVFVVNNDGYVSIRNSQNAFFGGFLVGASPETGVFIPPLEKLAAAYGLPYRAARKGAELGAVVRSVLAQPGPVLCEIFTPAQTEVIPTVSSVKLEDGSMRSKPLHEMAPFMDEATLARYLVKDD